MRQRKIRADIYLFICFDKLYIMRDKKIKKK